MCKFSFHRFCLCFCMSEVISSFKSLSAGSQVFALLMLFLWVILHTMWSGKSLQLLCILPFGMVCLSAISMMFVKKICWQCVCWWVWWSERTLCLPYIVSSCCCCQPTPMTLASGGVQCSRWWSTSQLLLTSGQQCSHSGGDCPQIQG